VTALVDGKRIVAGNRMLFQEKGIDIFEELLFKAMSYEEQGKTALLVAIAGRACGVLAIADRLKDSAPGAVAELKKMKLDVVMITGDNARSAAVVASQLGIEQTLSEVLPEEKASEVKRLQQSGIKVAFVGDGINDAPALAQADVGIAIGSGTDVAIEAGEIVLMKDDLMDVVASIQLSRKVISRIKLNIFWAFAYNAALVPVAAGVLYPFFGITFRPELAGLAMALSSVTVVSLSLLLKRYIPPARLDNQLEAKKMAIDPVCKMVVDEKTAKLKSDYKGKTYYFCAPGCKKAFEENPIKYLDNQGSKSRGCSCR